MSFYGVELFQIEKGSTTFTIACKTANHNPRICIAYARYGIII